MGKATSFKWLELGEETALLTLKIGLLETFGMVVGIHFHFADSFTLVVSFFVTHVQFFFRIIILVSAFVTIKSISIVFTAPFRKPSALYPRLFC